MDIELANNRAIRWRNPLLLSMAPREAQAGQGPGGTVGKLRNNAIEKCCLSVEDICAKVV
ncbi:hypothetical protein JYU34_006288 [Plutella xylostella]|uniref:Uncharacterized protein n=1 Tax=Plutella xylostella TaxID=51655 RepID=A0ABQ7QRN5_PLUXY|nr:hypothetical protein JYU34_006288 [Plutella xylostella]